MTKRFCSCWMCEGYGHTRRQEIRHGGVTEEELPAKGPRKKTRKWCKGKVGVKHVWSRQKPWDWTNSEVDVCDNCGKHGKYYWNYEF